LSGQHAKGAKCNDHDIYVAMNSYWDSLDFELPQPATGRQWHVAINTGAEAPSDCFEPGHEPRLDEQDRILVGGRSVVVLVGK
jgi:glycogen operon protein